MDNWIRKQESGEWGEVGTGIFRDIEEFQKSP
jgi:hypothetical protein